MNVQINEQLVSATDTARRIDRRNCALLFAVLLCWYVLLLNGGIRSPDCEIVFQTGQSLADHGTFAVEGSPLWPGFGVAKGLDGQQYSIFGPLQSILIVPFVRVAELINATGWYQHCFFPIPYSLLIDKPSFDAALESNPAGGGEVHALRFLTSFYETFIGALAALVFYRLLRRLKISPQVGLVTSILFGAGSLFSSYIGVMFTEPLSVLLVLSSLLFAVGTDGRRPSNELVASGILLGLGVATHITVMLFIPSFILYLYFDSGKDWKPILSLLDGLFVPLVVLGWFNYSRFGNPFETGRFVDPEAAKRYDYGHFVPPFTGLFGLVTSTGKSLLWYSPAILLAVPGWKLFLQKYRVLAITILATALVRILFIASREDWAGGFCLGPRLLVALVPLLIIPFGFWLALCIIQQWAFALGDVFNFYYHAFNYERDAGINIMHEWIIYFTPRYAPLLHILNASRSPFLMKWIPLSNEGLFIVGVIVIAVLWYSAVRRLVKA